MRCPDSYSAGHCRDGRFDLCSPLLDWLFCLWMIIILATAPTVRMGWVDCCVLSMQPVYRGLISIHFYFYLLFQNILSYPESDSDLPFSINAHVVNPDQFHLALLSLFSRIQNSSRHAMSTDPASPPSVAAHLGSAIFWISSLALSSSCFLASMSRAIFSLSCSRTSSGSRTGVSFM